MMSENSEFFVPEDIKRLIDEGALFVSNHSGGKDSQVMLIKLLDIVPVKQMVVTYADLGRVVWPGSKRLAQQQAENAGVPFIVAKANKTLLGMVEKRFYDRPEVPSWPSSSTRQCTSDLKRGPIQREVRRYAKENGFKTIVNCLGLRAGESTQRKNRAPFSKMGISNSVTTWYEWLPVHKLTGYDVFQEILDAGQQPHYAYGLEIINGHPVATKNQRLSCRFCFFAEEGDIKNGAKCDPELLNEYDQMEIKTGYTMHISRIPIVQIATTKQSNGKKGAAEVIAEYLSQEQSKEKSCAA